MRPTAPQTLRTRVAHAPRFAVLALLLGAACADGSNADSGTTAGTDGGADGADGGADDGTEVTFDSTLELAHPAVDATTGECEIGYYWPVTPRISPLMVVRYDAPDPPYEIRAFSATLFNDNGFGDMTCTSVSSLRVFAFVDSAETLEAYAITEHAWPDLPALASAELTGLGSDAVVYELATVELDEPVLVEEAGYLYVGYEYVDSDGVTMACAGGCEDDGLDAFGYNVENNLWGEPAGWSSGGGIGPDLRVTLAH